MSEPLERVSTANEDEALRYLAQRPFDNVYVYWLLATRQLRNGADMLLWRDAGGAVRGACSYGLQIVPSGDDVRALDAFGERARSSAHQARMIVGRRPDVECLWSHAATAFPKPRVVRTSQPLYAIGRSQLRYTRADADVAPATLAELDEIAVNASAMIAGEMGDDAPVVSNEFRTRTARIIQAGWLWRYRHHERLAFMCHIGAVMPATAQLQGVWTPPRMRGRGYATRALGAICDHLLDNVPNLSLYVNGYNTTAMALYERVGFERVGEFQTIMLGG
ncbi:MAG: GNAT family N-acetyltransferase [Candidatus Eremiobacteraeota bacterium]|nr:GNAT family N-acetyltransferase [Candidatus Eremiobacteraeota bacterium]MBC5804072.1 GNAT family N-acetyltransferase [Candidatus Eremiobacteraeota bacterium]MBC5821647.1 GNAT family N-acetyltransferase [Candidatus Eremiobacteraeota bacterium]